MDNESTDLQAPVYVRRRFADMVQKKRRYQVADLDRTDEALRAKLGITDGGQLPSATPQKLGEALGADAVVYGRILVYSAATTGLLNVRKVRARFTMVRCSDGAKLWEAEAESAEGEGAGSLTEAAVHGAASLVTQMGGKMAREPLPTQTLDMLFQVLESLPQARR